MAGKRSHRGFGYIRKLPSSRSQASYAGPDLERHNAPDTFQTKGDAERWLGGEQAAMAAGTWVSPSTRTSAAHRAMTFGQYAERWLARRELKPRTRDHYASLLERQILPAFGETPLKGITSEAVRDWHDDLDRTRPTLRAHAYGYCGPSSRRPSPTSASRSTQPTSAAPVSHVEPGRSAQPRSLSSRC